MRKRKHQIVLQIVAAITLIVGVIMAKQSVSATEIRTSGNNILGIFAPNYNSQPLAVTGIKIDQHDLVLNNEYSWRIATPSELAEFNQTHSGQIKDGGIEISCTESYFNSLSRNEPHHFIVYFTSGSIPDTMEFDFVIPTDSESGSDNVSICDHDYEWEIEREPTEIKDGEVDLRCTKCGEVKARQPLSSYAYFIKVSTEKISKAPAGSTVLISSKIWNSFPKSFFEELSSKQDIKVIMDFMYNHGDYEATISSSEVNDIISSSNSCAYYGPESLVTFFGATEKEN